MKIFDNITDIVRDDLKDMIQRGSKVSIAAACFIFTSPTFVQERAEKQKREFYIPRLSREASLYGTEFEIKLRNEMTQRAVARECADWIRRKAAFKSNVTGENLELLMLMVADITPEHDSKLQNLLRLLDEKMRTPINEGNKKVLIFSAFSDTAEYLYDHTGSGGRSS